MLEVHIYAWKDMDFCMKMPRVDQNHILKVTSVSKIHWQYIS